MGTEILPYIWEMNFDYKLDCYYAFITINDLLSQIQDNLCAALYDEEKCKRSEDFLELRNGDQGVLPLLTTGLRRNDVEVIH